MATKRMREAASVEAWQLRKIFFEFYVLLAARFSLRKRLIYRQGARRYAPDSVTGLTALTNLLIGSLC